MNVSLFNTLQWKRHAERLCRKSRRFGSCIRLSSEAIKIKSGYLLLVFYPTGRVIAYQFSGESLLFKGAVNDPAFSSLLESFEGNFARVEAMSSHVDWSVESGEMRFVISELGRNTIYVLKGDGKVECNNRDDPVTYDPLHLHEDDTTVWSVDSGDETTPPYIPTPIRLLSVDMKMNAASSEKERVVPRTPETTTADVKCCDPRLLFSKPSAVPVSLIYVPWQTFPPKTSGKAASGITSKTTASVKEHVDLRTLRSFASVYGKCCDPRLQSSKPSSRQLMLKYVPWQTVSSKISEAKTTEKEQQTNKRIKLF